MGVTDGLAFPLENAGTVWHAHYYRQLVAALVAKRQGVFGPNDLKVAQRAAGANKSVDVAVGDASVLNSEDATGNAGAYFVRNGGVLNLAIANADATNPRRDLIVVQVRDSESSGVDDDARILVVQGTPAGSPADPAVPNNCVTLARVAVAVGMTSIVTANITDLRPAMPYSGVKLTQQAITGGPTSGTTELTLATISLAAETVGYTLEASAFWGALLSVNADNFVFRIRVAGLQVAAVQARAGNTSARIPLAITSTPVAAIDPATAIAVTVSVQRDIGSGTITTEESGLLTVKQYFR